MRLDDSATVRTEVGRRVAELRAGHGFTQAQLAESLGITTRHLQSIEAGGENLTLDSLAGLANALDVTVRELFDPPTTAKPGRGRPAKARTNDTRPASSGRKP